MLTVAVRTYRPGDEPTVRKGGAVLPSSNAVGEAARRDRGRTTLAAIAAEAGVSLPTVSKVVNGRRDVAPATRALVERLLHEHQYTRAGTRRHRRSGLIDLVFLVTSELTGRQLEQLREADIPLVVLDPGNPPPPDLPSVGATNWAGGLAATEHLLGLGHRRIGAIAGPGDYLCSRARTDGYRSALERAGIKFNPALVRNGDFQHEAGFICGGKLLDLPEPPTAIFAGSDQQAFGLYEAARQRGLRVPQDLSVVGFDDLPVSRWVPPPLTTVRQPLDEMGRAAAQMLGDLIEGRPLLRSSRVE